VALGKKYFCTSDHMTYFLETEFTHSFHTSKIMEKTIRKGINQTLSLFKVTSGAVNRDIVLQLSKRILPEAQGLPLHREK
jgi:hypothetical protein